uniref:Alkyl transferase n=1 Tax=Acrobeloides nanus TaxID=290746 RepID=A0A914CSI5_9BILA
MGEKTTTAKSIQPVQNKNFEPEWFVDRKLPWWSYFAKRWLKAGPLPKHVAIIMDGNRRYARTHKYGSVIEGHSRGFTQLTQVLDWCRELGAIEVTVYAFSIENFKRSDEEVQGLMKMAEKKFEKLLQERVKLEEKRIRFRFFGNLKLLPIKLQKLMAEIEWITKDFEQGYINVCLAYTAQDEIARSMEYIRRGVQKGLLEEDDINEWLVSKCLDTRKSFDVDLLIRTSGENRLSDFMLWQCSNCYLHVVDVLWPEFDFSHLYKAFLAFQKNYRPIEELNYVIREDVSEKAKEKSQDFLDWMEKDRETYTLSLLES